MHRGLGAVTKKRSWVPCPPNAGLVLPYEIPCISQAVELLVLFLARVTKGKETENSCSVSIFFHFFSVLLCLVAQKLVALEEKHFPCVLLFFQRQVRQVQAGASVAEHAAPSTTPPC